MFVATYIHFLVLALLFQWIFSGKDESDLGPFSQWNITGTYRGWYSYRNLYLEF